MKQSCRTSQVFPELISHIVLTIGAGDEHPAFETTWIRNGVEYIRKSAVDEVRFGIAWATDYEGIDDIRTELATDLY